MSDTSRFEIALASAESWASIGRRAEVQYWLGTVAKDTATVPQLLRAADALLRVGDTDLVVVLMERARLSIRVHAAASARNAYLRKLEVAARQMMGVLRDALQPMAVSAQAIGRALTQDLHEVSQADFVAWT